MNEQKSEQLSAQISALMDDELTHEASLVIDNLLEDSKAKKTWERYHLIGEFLRGHLSEYYGNMADRVSSAIALEPTVLALRKRPSNLMKPVVGLAIAAGVAAVAIFNVQQVNQIQGAGQTIAGQPSIATSQPSLSNSIASSQLVGQAQVYQVKNIDPRLSRYLFNYNEYRANTGVSGMLPHARMVANEPESNK